MSICYTIPLISVIFLRSGDFSDTCNIIFLKYCTLFVFCVCRIPPAFNEILISVVIEILYLHNLMVIEIVDIPLPPMGNGIVGSFKSNVWLFLHRLAII